MTRPLRPDHPGRGRVAVVTGASRGIGRSCALALGRAGYDVVVGYATDAGAAANVVADLQAAGAGAVAVRGDVADEEDMSGLFDRADAAFGGVDAVVHAAGRMALAPIVDLDLTELDRLHRTNIRGTFVVDQQAARRVRAGGAIVNLSSSVVTTAFPTYGAYAASKGAVEALTLVLARELRGRDVTVNAVAPGPTATELFLDGKTDEQVRSLALAVPLERLGQPEDSAAVVTFLCGPAGRWVNGQVIRVNGGLV